MRYDQFRDALTQALHEAGLFAMSDRPMETIDLRSTTREWKAHLGRGARAEPFHMTTEISFRWDPVESARTYTTEEDLLSDLFGGHDDLPATLPRHLRTDIVLHASLLYGSRTPMPGAATWRSWSRLVDAKLSSALPAGSASVEGIPLIIMGWRGSVEVEAGCSEDGTLCLKGVSLPSWQAVVPPRVEDSSEDEPDGDAGDQLAALADQYAEAADVWAACVAALAEQIEYRPPRQ
jgi:hypothetical protein